MNRSPKPAPTASDPQMETLGVSCWDFAYPTGKCPPSSEPKCRFFESKKTSSHRARADLKTKQEERLVADPLAPGDATAKRTLRSHFRSKTRTDSATVTRTYLLSSPTLMSLISPHTYTMISTMLTTPHTKLVYLVPQKYIMTNRVCEISRLRRARGSGIQVLTVPPPIGLSGQDNSDLKSETERILAVDEVAQRVLKATTARAFDGYVTFEDDRAAWAFLEHVGQAVKSAASNGERV